MITFTQVSKRYPGGHEALGRINLSLETGEMAFLTGQSGAGKSTLLRLIALLEQPSTGHITVDGRRLDSLKPRDIPPYRASLGLTHQTPQLLGDRCVFENVALPLYIQGVSFKVITKRVRAALDLVDLLSKEKKWPNQLSGGEQQRVGIARAVVHKPRLLLADEPTGNLDPALSLDIMNTFEHLNQAGVGVLVATHDLTLIASMKHRIIRLKGGCVC